LRECMSALSGKPESDQEPPPWTLRFKAFL